MGATVRTGRWDEAVTVVLGLVLAAAAAGGFVVVGLSAFIADSCVDVRCDDTRFDVGLLVGLAGQPAVLVAATVASFVLRARGRRTFIAPLIGLVLVAAVLLCALWTVYSAVPGASVL